MPIVINRNTHIEPQTLFTQSAILSSGLLPRTCSEVTSRGLCSSGARRISCPLAQVRQGLGVGPDSLGVGGWLVPGPGGGAVPLRPVAVAASSGAAAGGVCHAMAFRTSARPGNGFTVLESGTAISGTT